MANAALSSAADPTQTMSPPPGMESPTQEDFVYSITQANATIVFGAIVTALTVISVIARSYTHNFIIRRVRVDDVWAVIAMVRHLDCARGDSVLLTRLFSGGRNYSQYLAEYFCVQIAPKHDVDERGY